MDNTFEEKINAYDVRPARERVDKIVTVLNENPHLRRLRFMYAALSDLEQRLLFDAILRSDVDNLDLDNLDLTASEYWKVVFSSKKLTRLSLVDLRSQNEETFFNKLRGNTILRSLQLRDSRCVEKPNYWAIRHGAPYPEKVYYWSIISLVAALQSNMALEELDLDMYRFEDDSDFAIAKWLSTNPPRLTSFALEHHSFDLEHVEYILQAVGVNTVLQRLEIDSERFDNIIDNVAKSRTLRELKVTGNEHTDVKPLFRWLAHQSKLEKLSVQGCYSHVLDEVHLIARAIKSNTTLRHLEVACVDNLSDDDDYVDISPIREAMDVNRTLEFVSFDCK